MKRKVQITLDRERFLKLDLNAMSEFENLTGNSLFTIGEKLLEAKNMRAILYACFKSAKEEITLEEVGDLIGIDNFEMVSKKLQELMDVSYGKQNDAVGK